MGKQTECPFCKGTAPQILPFKGRQCGESACAELRCCSGACKTTCVALATALRPQGLRRTLGSVVHLEDRGGFRALKALKGKRALMKSAGAVICGRITVHGSLEDAR